MTGTLKVFRKNPRAGSNTSAIFKMAPVPVAVSPLIKFSRYSALFLGIAYGSRRNKSLEKSEAELLKLKEHRKAAEEKKVAAAKDVGDSIFD